MKKDSSPIGLQTIRDRWYPIGHAFISGGMLFFYILLRKDGGTPPNHLDKMQPLDILLLVCVGLCLMIGAAVLGVIQFRCADWSRLLNIDPGGLRRKYFKSYFFLLVLIVFSEILVFLMGR
ncbi:MAG: hypothetical protein IPH75_08025 [bacterium]|nr:hypothetical protein [bacterium]